MKNGIQKNLYTGKTPTITPDLMVWCAFGARCVTFSRGFPKRFKKVQLASRWAAPFLLVSIYNKFRYTLVKS